MLEIFLQIAIVLLIVLAVSFIMRFLKQPLIIGYIVSGIIVGPFFFDIMHFSDAQSVFSELGIAFLLFIVGLHLSPRVIREVGKIALITGIGQVLFTSLIGYLICQLLGFNHIASVYVAVALTFSSTIIIMKLLSDKDALDTLYGKISIGFLLVQDLIAVVILIFLASFSSSNNIGEMLNSLALRAIAIAALLIPLQRFVLPWMGSIAARSQELLFLFALSIGLGCAALFHYSGFSMEVGALVGGVMLSTLPYAHEISSKLRPLRDFFIIYFFIQLGSQMMLGDIIGMLLPIALLSLFILVGNPLIVIILMQYYGYSRKTSFMAGLTVAQISEFSLILVTLGVKLEHFGTEVLSVVTMIGITTIAGSTYMIIYSERLYKIVARYIGFFPSRIEKEANTSSNELPENVLIGENRIGFSIMREFQERKKQFIVIDFDPERIKHLKQRGIKCIYGDIADVEFIDCLNFRKVKMVVSTINEHETNLFMVHMIREMKRKAVIIATALRIDDAKLLYDAGADYVIMPHLIGGTHVAMMIEKFGDRRKDYEKERKNQLRLIGEKERD